MYQYVISPPPEGSWALHVEATFEHAPSGRLVAPGAEEGILEVAPLNGDPSIGRDKDAWLAPACLTRCSLRYTVDLDALASACRRLDCSRRVGDAIIGTSSTWMLRPEGVGDAVVHVRTAGGQSNRFATGLRRDRSGGYVFRANEFAETSYTAFGSFRRARVGVPGAELDVALLGAPLAMGDAATLDWLKGSATCVARLFGRFPADASVFIVPISGADEVVFGRVMSLAGASVALLFGDQTRPESAHRDWVVVHELFHLGCPSFVGEGHWLEEGLATYYEPLLRERAGWMTEAELWAHFVREMPRGLRKEGEAASLEKRDDIDSTYWGGALFALLADVRIRQETRGVRSLDDVMRAVLAREGNATHTARVADFVRSGDETTGTHVLAALYDSWALRGQNVDLELLWRDLGVDGRTGEPLAGDSTVRQAIASSTGH
jgi:predicted metalloprotease with PDZ domain